MINKFNCDYPCDGIMKEIIYPKIELEPDKITTVIISECPTENASDYFYNSDTGTFFENTKVIFNDAGITVSSYDDLLNMGIYLTTALKCRKLDYLVSAKTIKECSLRFLKRELEQFPNIKVILCMGYFAIKAVNYIYNDKYKSRVIEAGATYKIRNREHISHGIRFFPSYTHTGDSFNIEKSKRKMIVEDIKNAFIYLSK